MNKAANALYDKTSRASIFAHSGGLLGRTLAAAVKELFPAFDPGELTRAGKGGLGQLVEECYYGYQVNSSPEPDFREAGIELKTTPLKRTATGELAIKERLSCDMIDYCKVVDLRFEESPFYKKSLLMLILFYLHVKGRALSDLEFIYSVLWELRGKDLQIIKRDYETIVGKIRAGRAHELSEGDTLYLAASRKGQKGDSLRKQPFNKTLAPRRAFALKPAYMRTVLEFVKASGRSMVTNTEVEPVKALASERELAKRPFEEILTRRLMKFKGLDYREIASRLGLQVSPRLKNRYAYVVSAALLKGLKRIEDAEEIKKAGIIAKTIRVQTGGRIRESMSFENIDYAEVLEEETWEESRWYEIATSRFMFIVFREAENLWNDETSRFVLEGVIFWTMPPQDLETAEAFWQSIRDNVRRDTLLDSNNTFWRQGEGRCFHVRPKASDSRDQRTSPKSGVPVPKKAYWFNNDYVQEILLRAGNFRRPE